MSDIEAAAQALQGGLPGTALTVGGLWAARRMLGPTIDVVGDYAANATKKRLENIGSIFAKVEQLNPEPDAYPHVRTAFKVLNDASLYDDDFMQTYVAGLVAGSRNADGSDDRPIFYLTLIDGLTSMQLRMFHILYAAQRQNGPVDPARLDPISNFVSVTVDDVNAALDTFKGGPENDVGAEILVELEHVGLLGNVGFGPSDDDWRVKFTATRVGVILYRWAHGMPTQDVKTFFHDEMPDIGLNIPPFSSLRPA